MDGRGSGLIPEALLVDFADIDVQHEQLFSFLETLKNTCFGSSDIPAEGFRRLIHDLEMHFAAEEALASRLGIEFSEHAVAHQENSRAVLGSLESVLSGSGDAYTFLRYVEIWLERHILQFDRPFALEVKARTQTSASPSREAGVSLS